MAEDKSVVRVCWERAEVWGGGVVWIIAWRPTACYGSRGRALATYA